jgi:heme/copper-type cytochrome/quinol oxidase subunit 1
MSDILFIIVFMGIVVGLAAGILWLIDKLTISRGSNAEEKAATVERRTVRWQRGWRICFIAMAAISLPINLVGLIRKTEPLFPTILWVFFALLIILGALNPYTGGD